MQNICIHHDNSSHTFIGIHGAFSAACIWRQRDTANGLVHQHSKGPDIMRWTCWDGNYLGNHFLLSKGSSLGLNNNSLRWVVEATLGICRCANCPRATDTKHLPAILFGKSKKRISMWISKAKRYSKNKHSETSSFLPRICQCYVIPCHSGPEIVGHVYVCD